MIVLRGRGFFENIRPYLRKDFYLNFPKYWSAIQAPKMGEKKAKKTNA